MLTARFLSVISGVSQLAPKQEGRPGDKTTGGKEKRKENVNGEVGSTIPGRRDG